ncbi:hypothetical protein BP6252_13672 [Coleophoma cylindrospora]|uniref:Serine hydrolase domain-containing protein n=1 Tax=Coleophoma cylindrospora TaxID=1849047 RepID=A0A3D8Q8X2_9HELO|nr:hypothetical protein BP6252_13672 [Coleophoma cylindrospora]
MYEHMTLESIKDGHQWLAKYIQENGPYDAVMGFSQGCSLASSFLIAYRSDNPHTAPPFKAAIFICGGIPVDVLSSYGIDVTQEALDWDRSSKIDLMNQASSEAILRDGKNRWGPRFSSYDNLETAYSQEGINSSKSTMVFGIDVAKIPKEMKIPIPTVHIFGSRDPRFPASLTLAQFCDERLRRLFDHGGGHEVPRTTNCSTALADSVQWCAKMVGL